MFRHRHRIAPGLLALCLAAPALAAPNAPASPKPVAHVASPAAAGDNAPFYTGRPMAAAYRAAQAKRIALARADIAKMLAVKGPRTAANTLAPYDDAMRQLDMANSQAGLVSAVHPDKATREAAEKASQDVSAYATELSLDRRVYDALAALDLSAADADTKRYVEHTLMEFRLSGVDKDSTTRARIRVLSDSLVTIGQTFDRNIREDHSKVTCTVAELDGLPKDFIDGHKPAADGTVTLTIEYPDYLPVMQYARNDGLRRRMYMAYQNRAFPANIGVLDRMRARRHELAQLVGFTNFADYVTADKMSGNAATARDFIARVVAASNDRQAREYQQLLDEKKTHDAAATAVEFWQFPYERELLRNAQYQFDSKVVREYFPYDRVQAGVLDIMSRLFGVTFKRVRGVAVWHPSVECYEMWQDGRLAGRFYLDMHPRANKYNHAAQFNIRAGIEGRQIPEGALVCNLSGGKPGDPGLCDMDDVDTFFHEFGHLMHTMFARHSRWYGLDGITTEQDFIEAPSQMLEEWMRSPEVLATFAKHYKTGAPIPAALVKQMNRANGFGRGLDVRRQMVYAGLSLACFDRDPATANTTDLMQAFVKQYQPFPFVDGTHFQCSFGHLDGYSAIYYTYMWSLVIAKDMFAQFDKDHLLAPEVALRYRRAVLEGGSRKPAAELVKDFLGRPFDEKAWKKWLDSDE